MRIMSLDYGKKKVGVASTDESGEFALPRAVWPNDANLLDRIFSLIEQEKVTQVVLGESKNLTGGDNPVAQDIHEFKKVLEARGLEVILHPEIFTTVEARRLQGNTDMTDASAAALILKNFLETRENKV